MKEKRKRHQIDERGSEGYADLGQAIIFQAARDYKHNLAIHKSYPYDEAANNEISRIETFFHSALYGAITTYDPDKLIQQLREEF